jgi:hypothetical protein
VLQPCNTDRSPIGSPQWIGPLTNGADTKQLTKLINRYRRVDLILVDELGYPQLDRRGAELLFQVLTERDRALGDCHRLQRAILFDDAAPR